MEHKILIQDAATETDTAAFGVQIEAIHDQLQGRCRCLFFCRDGQNTSFDVCLGTAFAHLS